MRSNLAKLLAAASALTMAAPAMAHLVGATYDFSTSVTGNTAIGAASGTFTDPANPGFCVGPPVACGSGSGVSGSFTFSSPTSTLSEIAFTFFGSTAGAGPGSFSIDLSDFVTTDHERITAITHSSGNLFQGDFTNVTWNGTTAVFTGSTGSEYNAIGGTTVVFDATTVVPEPSTWAMMLLGLAGLGFVSYRKTRKAVSIAP
jgi:hypothetical protein